MVLVEGNNHKQFMTHKNGFVKKERNEYTSLRWHVSETHASA